MSLGYHSCPSVLLDYIRWMNHRSWYRRELTRFVTLATHFKSNNLKFPSGPGKSWTLVTAGLGVRTCGGSGKQILHSGSCVMSFWRMRWQVERQRSVANEHYSHTGPLYPSPFLFLIGLVKIHHTLSWHWPCAKSRPLDLLFHPENVNDTSENLRTIRWLGVNGKLIQKILSIMQHRRMG